MRDPNDSGDIQEDYSGRTGFQSIENAATDLVLSMSFDCTGTRVVLCSADHKLRVYNVDERNEWTLIDQWRGHDAEILDAQWIDSSLGQLFATIASDNRFKIWREDPSHAPQSGRRFRCIFSQSPPNHVSYISFEFKTRQHDIWLGLMTQDGLLSLLEPSESETLSSWKEIDVLYPFGKHHRGAEPRFDISFHHAQGPSSQAIAAGLDLSALSLAVSAACFMKVYRATKQDESNYQLQEMIEISTENIIINHIAWAPGPLHPHDVIAAACDDGTVRIFDVTMPPPLAGMLTNRVTQKEESGRPPKPPSGAAQNAPSGIGAGLAGMSRTATTPRVGGGINLKHEWKEVAILHHHDCAQVWKVIWIFDGSALASTGDNGKVHLWKQGLERQYYEFSETAPL